MPPYEKINGACFFKKGMKEYPPTFISSSSGQGIKLSRLS
jgi:hypothetical protein